MSNLACIFIVSASLVTTTFANHVVLPLDVSPDGIQNTTCNEYSYFKVNFPYPCRDLNVSLDVFSGAPEIYISKLLAYPTKHDLTWSAVEISHFVISHWDPESSPGYYNIAIYNNCKYQGDLAQYSIAASSSNSSALDESDIYTNPSMSYQKTVQANDYDYFHFCVPTCADVTVTLQNCLDNTICPGAYSFPELLVSRTQSKPTIFDYSFKLASSVRRSVFINHTDPAARDRNNFLSGSYFVGVFGWCTPDDKVVNVDYDGPCSYAANSFYNVTVRMTFLYITMTSELLEFCAKYRRHYIVLQTYILLLIVICLVPHYFMTTDDDGACDAENLVYNSLPTSVVKIATEQDITGIVACNEFNYYLLQVDNPCAGMNLFLHGTANISATSVPELSVGKWPNLHPTFDNLQWTSYNWGHQNLTLDVWDPNFEGGASCGADGHDPCTLVIGVLGYCAADQTPVPYILRATPIALTATANIYQVPQLNQKVEAHSGHSYGICVSDDVNVTAQLVSWDTGCDCPNNYVHLQMVLSRTNPAAVSSDLAWTVDHDDAVTSIDILSSDPASRPGTYYLNVYGWCTEDEQCVDPCSCAPCSNLALSSYAVLVTNDSSLVSNITINRLSYLGDACQDAEADITCAASTVCAYVKGTDNHRDELSTGDKVGISIGAIVFFTFLVLLLLYCTGYLVYKHSGYGFAKDGEDLHLSSNAEDEVSTQLDMKMGSV